MTTRQRKTGALYTLALFPLIVWVYVRLARKEERSMIEQFGDEYRLYRERVPMFFPRRGEWRHLFGAAPPAAQERP